jgi:TonB-linked SusC/RagA family outer membrane protein
MRKCNAFLAALVLCVLSTQLCAQEKSISLNFENVKLEQVLGSIEKQSNYLFVYGDNVDVDQLVSIAADAKPLRHVLNELLPPAGIQYTISNTSIALSAAPKSDAGTTRRVSGRITAENGQPIVGATVVVKGTTIGTATGADGQFALDVPASSAASSLLVNFMGYEQVDLPMANKTSFAVVLKEATLRVDEVVVTALGIKRSEKALSYNVQTVSSDDIVTNKDANFINALNGKVAGLAVNASSSGVGGASKVVMRGTKSIMQSSNVLYVIDGVPMFAPRKSDGAGGSGTEQGSQGISDPIADLNPEDIASMSVLSGAAASALYGSDAANGVILITTKKGEAGKVNVTVTSNVEVSAPFVLPRFQTRYGTGDLATSAPVLNESWGAKLNQFNHMGYDPRTDYFQTGVTATESVSLTTGTERSQTYLSAGAVNSEGIVPNNTYDRYNFTFRNTTKFLDDKMTLDLGASYIIQDDCNMTSQGEYFNPLWGAYLFPRGNDWNEVKMYERWDPNRSLSTQYWTPGDYGGTVQNPYWINNRNLRENQKKRYMLNAALDYKILDWLNVSGRVNVDNSTNDYTEKLYATTHLTLTELSDRGFYGISASKDRSIYADAMFNINKTFGCWSLQANVGGIISDIKSDLMSVRGPLISEGLVTGATPTLSNFFTLQNISPNSKREQVGYREQIQSVFASAEIGLLSTYYLTLTGRNDWPSMLAGPYSEKKSFFYPSVGLSAVVSNIVDMPKWISYLKVRGSFASVGVSFARELANPRHPWNGTQWGNRTVMPTSLKPERTDSWEVGLSSRFFRGLSIDFTFYDSDTKNQTFEVTLPPSSPYTGMYAQTGSVRNRGVELVLGYKATWGKFGYDAGYTFSANSNKIMKIATDIYDPQSGAYITSIDQLDFKPMGYVHFLLRDGGTMGDLYSVSDFLRDANGNIYIDQNGNISSAQITDPEKFIKLGSVLPKANMAWRNNFSYGNFNLGFMVSARIGGVVYSRTQGILDYYGVSENSAAARDLGYVTVNGSDQISAETYYKALGATRDIPQYYTYSATNVRLSEASVGYTIPRKWLGDVCDISVSLVGRNLWMIYNKAPFDPESVGRVDNFYQGIDYMMMPSLRNVGFNLRIKF